MIEPFSERIGFIGLGDMGGPMAENLGRAGAHPVVYDRRSDLGATGAVAAASVSEVAELSDIVFVCVVDAAQVEDVLVGPGGLFPTWEHRDASRPAPLVVIHSTVPPATIRAMVGPGERVGAGVVDAAVSGGRSVAVAGELTLMVGGSADSVTRCQPFFRIVGSKVFHVGDQPGAGEMAKLCNNIMAICNGFATLEAVKLSTAYGIDERRLIEIASVSTGDSWMIRNWGFIDQVNATHGSPVETFTKDLIYAMEAAQDAALDLPLVSSAVDVAPALLADRQATVRRAEGPIVSASAAAAATVTPRGVGARAAPT